MRRLTNKEISKLTSRHKEGSMTELTPGQITSGLSQFTGTENYYKHPLFTSFTYTDGVRYVAQKCNAYWLIDAILSHQTNPIIKREEFQVWKLVKQPNGWNLLCDDGNNNLVVEQKIEFSDFPLNEITIWLANGVLHLPSEY